LLKEPNLSSDKQQQYIEIIERSGHRMLNIINDIIDISKIEAGLIKLNIVESNINLQLEYIYTFFKPEVEAKGMKLAYRNSLTEKESIIKTDREKVFAILTNLVKNAIKYSKAGEIEFGNIKRNGYLEFYVKDTGIGIPKDRQQAIFERFIQADLEDLHARQGAGLGLAITKSYVEMLGGEIWVESEEGIGSTFYFTLPCHTESEDTKTVNKVVLADGKESLINDLKILIAEDDETSDMLISINVKKLSKDVIHAKTGIETVEICRTNPDIDVILMDIKMPGLNGYEATRQIRQFNKNVVIIAQTAYGLTNDREKAIEAGCNDYISKPINKDALLAIIQKYFGK
jgi:CheY-like chemotaxis protein